MQSYFETFRWREHPLLSQCTWVRTLSQLLSCVTFGQVTSSSLGLSFLACKVGIVYLLNSFLLSTCCVIGVILSTGHNRDQGEKSPYSCGVAVQLGETYMIRHLALSSLQEIKLRTTGCPEGLGCAFLF